MYPAIGHSKDAVCSSLPDISTMGWDHGVEISKVAFRVHHCLSGDRIRHLYVEQERESKKERVRVYISLKGLFQDSEVLHKWLHNEVHLLSSIV